MCCPSWSGEAKLINFSAVLSLKKRRGSPPGIPSFMDNVNVPNMRTALSYLIGIRMNIHVMGSVCNNLFCVADFSLLRTNASAGEGSHDGSIQRHNNSHDGSFICVLKWPKMKGDDGIMRNTQFKTVQVSIITCLWLKLGRRDEVRSCGSGTGECAYVKTKAIWTHVGSTLYRHTSSTDLIEKWFFWDVTFLVGVN